MRFGGEATQTLVTFLTGGGLVALVTQGTKAWGSMRSGARATTRAVLRDLAEDRDEAEKRLDHERRVAEYWRMVAGNYGYQLRANGIVPDPEKPIPPEQAVKQIEKARRSIKHLEDSGEIRMRD